MDWLLTCQKALGAPHSCSLFWLILNYWLSEDRSVSVTAKSAASLSCPAWQSPHSAASTLNIYSNSNNEDKAEFYELVKGVKANTGNVIWCTAVHSWHCSNIILPPGWLYTGEVWGGRWEWVVATISEFQSTRILDSENFLTLRFKISSSSVFIHYRPLPTLAVVAAWDCRMKKGSLKGVLFSTEGSVLREYEVTITHQPE